ncbi:MAG: hypothetical protein V3R86_06890, partial [Candidatus Hydrothermarchaeaceae archaeon]
EVAEKLGVSMKSVRKYESPGLVEAPGGRGEYEKRLNTLEETMGRVALLLQTLESTLGEDLDCPHGCGAKAKYKFKENIYYCPDCDITIKRVYWPPIDRK